MEDSLKPDLKEAFDNTTLWSTNAQKPHHFNRMDPNPDPDSDSSLENALPIVKRNRDGTIKMELTKDDWQRFWAGRLRQQVDAPGLSDSELYGIFCRDKRIYFKQKQMQAKSKPSEDPDMPPCFYWNNKEIIKWAEGEGFPALITEMLSNNGICGRELITLDASTLQKAGLYDLDVIKTVTQAVRKLLGLPRTNGLRATGRPVPLEMFLRLKVRTGRLVELLTFQQFCENEEIEYGPAKQQMAENYRPIPETCRVIIKPYKYEKVKWIPTSAKPTHRKNDNLYDDSYSHLVLSDSAGSSCSSDNLGGIPTVEELADSVFLRSSLIQDVLDDIIRAVYKKIAHNNKLHHEVTKETHEVIKTRLEEAYMDFNINSAEDKLKFVTVIAEELVDDVIRAREILNDIDKFQEKIREVPDEQRKDLQQAIAHYVQSIMPLVVSAALKEMEESTVDFQTLLNDAASNETQVNGTSSTILIMKRLQSVQESSSNVDITSR